MTVVDRINARVASRRLLDHPFYVAWSMGELTREDLQGYAAQYYQWVLAMPTWISATHANATTLEMRQSLLENLIDEERGPENHPELWLRFCDALGLDRSAVKATPMLLETREAIAAMRQVCRNEPAPVGLAALYAYESQQPEVMKTKREGLRDRYGLAMGHDYFEVHETLDVEHSGHERELLERYAEAHADAAEQAARTATDATYLILDGIERARKARRISAQ